MIRLISPYSHVRMGRMMNSKGNALVIVLIGIALFAALSYSLMSSSLDNSIKDQERLRLSVTEMTEYVLLLNTTMQRMAMVHKCDIGDFSFVRSPYTSGETYYNASAPTTNRCHVFHPDGGGLVWRDAPEGLSLSDVNYKISGGTRFEGHGSDTTDMAELVIYLPDISEDLCEMVNKEANGYTIAQMTDAADFLTTPFTGTFANYAMTMSGSDYMPDIGCVTASSISATETPNTHFFYGVLFDQ